MKQIVIFFLSALLIISFSRSVKMIRRSGISDFERRLASPADEDPTAAMDSADNRFLNSGDRKSRDDVTRAGQPSQPAQEEALSGALFDHRNPEIPHNTKEKPCQQADGDCGHKWPS